MSVTSTADVDAYDKFLACHELQPYQYTTGLYQRGITIYKQQVRALNLIFSLFKTSRLKRGDAICVVGGGVAGLTIAAAALRSGVEVLLLEKESMFLPLQHGCDTRFIYPHLYNWPEGGSLSSSTKLPILPWEADTAANVAKQILQGFIKILKEGGEKMFIGLVDVRTDHNLPLIEEKSALGKRFSVTASGKRFKFEEQEKTVPKKPPLELVDLIVYSTGFGIEESCEDKVTPSYWRNDDYGQIVVNGKDKFHISGLGDGALVDLFRLKIRGFSYELFLKKYESIDKDQHLTNALLEIKKRAETSTTVDPVSYYKEFENIKPLLKPLINFLMDYRRSNIHVTLAAHNKNFDSLESNQLIDLKRISFVNGLIFYLMAASNDELDNYIWYTFWPGETKKIKLRGKWSYNVMMKDHKTGKEKPRKIDKDSTLILRHGTKRSKAFHGTRVPNKLLKALKTKQEASPFLNKEKPLWTYSEFVSLFVNKKESAFLTLETITLCSTFASILSHTLQSVSRHDDTDQDEVSKKEPAESELNVKVCLYRIIRNDHGIHYQRVTPFFGSEDSSDNLGNILPIEVGPLGMAACLQQPLLLNKVENELPEILSSLNMTTDMLSKTARSVLIIPILGQISDNELATNLLLYIDCDQADFFYDENMIHAVINTTDAWIYTIDRFSGEHILMDDLQFSPKIEISDSQLDIYKQLQHFSTFNIGSGPHRDALDTLHPKMQPLVFNQFYSFDVYHNLMK